MRTLVVSDLHLGARRERDVLRRAEPRARLLETLRDCERLVLLGDVIELRHGPQREALAAALPVLRELGAALPAGSQIVLVPGNHDHRLLARWFERRAAAGAPGPLGLEAEVDWSADDPLSLVADALGAPRLSVRYPGVWLREGVYATHGHYGDRHTTVPMLERLGAGAMTRVARAPAGGPRRAEDYEAVLAPLYAWIDAVAQHDAAPARGASAQAWHALSSSTRGSKLRRLGLLAAFPVLLAVLNRAGLGPLRRDISGPELRRAALRAFGEVLARLEIPAEYVIFGHTHRAGPLPHDAEGEWVAPTGARLINAGCWVHEPAFLGARPQASPYRAGFAVRVEDPGPPRLVNLLD